MQSESYTSTTNNGVQQKRRYTSSSAITPHISDGNAIEQPLLQPDEYQILDAIQRRVLWLSTLMVHHANSIRPNPDDLKVGGHQASSASMVSILTALYFHFLAAGDRVSIKPHASPAYHAIQYLLGNLERKYLQTLRAFKGLQAYPSRTKDPDPVDFSTGSVGLGAAAPMFAAVAQRYAQQHFGHVTSRRFIAVVGDAELDEGNVWEAAIDESLQGLGNILLIVDLNRQSLDRVVPGIHERQLKQLFTAAGWHVIEAKYGRQLQEVFTHHGGAAFRQRIDEMSNEEYQNLLLRSGAEIRSRLLHPEGPDGPEQLEIAAALRDTPDEQLHDLLSNLGGHDLNSLLEAFSQADEERNTPTVIFAYTIKGWGLPFAGDAMNHSMLLSEEQIKKVQQDLGIAPGTEWDAFEPDSAEGRYCHNAAERLRLAEMQPTPSIDPSIIPVQLGLSYRGKLSTQEALGRILPRLLEIQGMGERVVTVAPDVAISTHLSGWINKAGVFAPNPHQDYQADMQRALRWQPDPKGQHLELGISEMNLFMLLGQLGLCYELSGQLLLPIGTVYDPFVCRGLDALIYGLYSSTKMIFVGTPSGISLSPEGGAHQSTVTGSLGTELPQLNYYEPTFAREVEWILLDALRECCDRIHGNSSYLRLSTKKIDQRPLEEVIQRIGEDKLRQQVLAGGYRLLEGRDLVPGVTPDEIVQIVTNGAMVPEALTAAHQLSREGIAANVIHLTSPRHIFTLLCEARERRRKNAYITGELGHLQTLFPPDERRAPIITIQDASAHNLAFLGSIYGVPTVPLGINQFGQSGSLHEIYRQVGISIEDITIAGHLALELAADARHLYEQK